VIPAVRQVPTSGDPAASVSFVPDRAAAHIARAPRPIASRLTGVVIVKHLV
jgi:hypothetical protein